MRSFAMSTKMVTKVSVASRLYLILDDKVFFDRFLASLHSFILLFDFFASLHSEWPPMLDEATMLDEAAMLDKAVIKASRNAGRDHNAG